MPDMKKAFAAAAFATAVLTGAGGANAAQYINTSPVAADGSISWTFGDDGGIAAGAFDETFDFTVPASGVWSGTLTTSHTSASNDLSFGPYPAKIATINGIPYTIFLKYFESFDTLPAVAGGATIVVHGVSPGPTGSYAGTLTFSPDLGVPEPAAWALMILGFGGMAMAMRTHRRRGQGAAFLLA